MRKLIVTRVNQASLLTHDSVWSQVTASMTSVRSIFSENDTVGKGLKAFALRLYSPAVERVGWKYLKNESFLTGQLRSLLIAAAGGAGHERQVYVQVYCSR